MSERPGVLARIMGKVVITDAGCWEFQGRRTAFGYGRITVQGLQFVTHRVTYEHAIGPIPEGLQLDHLCRNPPCCNPAHLDPVTARENVRRARALATHCENGHEYAAPVGTRRRCAECSAASGRRRSQRYFDRHVRVDRNRTASCAICGEEYPQTRADRKYCSRRCRSKAERTSRNAYVQATT